MNLFPLGEEIIIGSAFTLDEFPEMRREHVRKFPKTLKIEEKYKDLIHSELVWPQLEEFIKRVCKWGHGSRVWGNVRKNYLERKSELVDKFNEARSILIDDEPDLSQALHRVVKLDGLGISFASKQLRFMLPQQCPVYDSILNTALPYAFNPVGYKAFAEDCARIAKLLMEEGIENPVRKSGTWWVADVEAAIFSRFYKKK